MRIQKFDDFENKVNQIQAIILHHKIQIPINTVLLSKNENVLQSQIVNTILTIDTYKLYPM